MSVIHKAKANKKAEHKSPAFISTDMISILFLFNFATNALPIGVAMYRSSPPVYDETFFRT